MESLIQDLKYGLRSLRKNPVFATVATLTLTLAIGVNTAIFSLVSVVVFADLPMQDAETVAIVRGVNPELGVDQGSVSVPDFRDLRERAESFRDLAALTNERWVLTDLDQPQRIRGYRATHNLLDNWRLPPQFGRDFTPDDARSGAPSVALISSGFWESQFGGGRDAVGSTLRLDGVEYTVIGVLDERMNFADFGEADIWVPLKLSEMEGARADRRLFVTGRLKEGVTQEQATGEVEAIGRALAAEYPESNAGWSLWSAPTMESLMDDTGRTIMVLLMLMVGFVILIACANIANMLLARATARAREFSVRTALGAGRARLIRQLLTESFVISLMSATLGFAFAYGLIEVLVRISNGTEPVFLMAELDVRVMAFTLGLAVVAPLVFGLFPALRASGSMTSAVLRDGRGADGSRSGKRARSLLVGAQVALAFSLMILAGLLVRSVENLHDRELGYDPTGLVAVDVDLPETEYPDPESRRIFFERAIEEITDLGNVQAAATVDQIAGTTFGIRRGVEIEGRPLPEGQARPPVAIVTASPGYFDLLNIPVLSGRSFDRRDGPDAPPVVILSRRVADRHWPDEDPIGRRIRTGTDESDWMRVIGVVGDVRDMRDTEQPAPSIYVPYAQADGSSQIIAAKTTAQLSSISGALRSAIWSVDPNQPIDRVTTFDQALYDFNAGRLALLLLFVVFALFALALAAIGVYGVMSYSVSRRRPEIGLRMALGAEVRSVRSMIVGQGMKILAGGIAVGLIVSFFLARLVSGIVFGIPPTDPLTFGVVTLTMIGVALLANVVPAVRATRTDPAEVLRAE